MDLLDQLRSLRDLKAAELPIPPMLDPETAYTFLSGSPDHAALLTHAMDLIVGSTDADLLAAYQRTNGEPGNPEADALLAEIERRGLGI